MLIYNLGKQEKENWIIAEKDFNENQLGKCESIFYLGNGYMGVRSATEESYLQEKRGMFVSGTFNKFDEKEVTELPNMPDVTAIEILIDNERFDLSKMITEEYLRILDMKEGELRREVTVITSTKKKVNIQFRRIVSLNNFHILAQCIEIISDQNVQIKIKSGIEAKVTNSGYQHLSVQNKRFYEGRILQGNYQSTQSKIGVSINTTHIVKLDGNDILNKLSGQMEMDSRSIYMNYEIFLEKRQRLEIQKISGIYTDRDLDMSENELKEASRHDFTKEAAKGYEQLKKESTRQWEEIWRHQDILIESEHAMDQLGIRFAIFHMIMMTPQKDNRVNIGAKALSGEGYKGHTFWDTEIFLLPFWIYTNPKVARNLLEYRYLSIDGARKKAIKNGYKGAMYPWESAWITDGEVTPTVGAADVITGKEMPIICGDIEQHITADVAFGVWEYFQITDDKEFMKRYGYEIIFDTATFWASRVEWSKDRSKYEIKDVIGPDEYSEHVNNNAYTNHMARWNMRQAVIYYEECLISNEVWFQDLSQRLKLDIEYIEWKEKEGNIYVPEANEQLLVPQDDDYLTYPIIDLKKYKESPTRADIIKDYNMEQISHMQVSKQADVLVLFYMMESLFPKDIKKANFYYYEDKCLHDSSLSLATHSIIASDLKEEKMAYEFFQRALTIDLGPDMNSPKDGIHAASMGGIWQCVINGFAGVRLIDNQLRVNPNLPSAWKSIRFKINWKGVELQFSIGKDEIEIYPCNMKRETDIVCYDKIYHIDNRTTVRYE